MLDNVRDDIPGWADPLPSNGKPFGAVVADAYTEYGAGDLVKVTFNAGSPRNSPMRGGTFLLVEKLNGANWEILRTDADVDTT
jgi:neutral ceramidase